MKLQRILARAIIGVSCLLTLALTLGMYLEMTTRNAQQAAVPLQLMVERCVNETSALLQTGQSCAQRIAQGGAATRALQPVDGEREAAIAVVEMSAAARDNLPVLLVNLQGRVVSASEMALNGLQIEQNILNLMQKSGGVIITPRTEALYANAPPCVAAVSPVERGGARVGYALVRLDVSLFDACVQNIARLPHSTLVMFDSAGVILSAEGDDVEYASLSQLVNASDLNAKKSESDAFTLRLKGNKLRAAYRRIESAHWNVLCTLKPMNLGGTWWWLLLPAAVVALFAVWLCLLLNKVLERSYTVPMRALSESILQIEAGDYTRSVPHLGKTELGEVGTAFNSMLARIRRDHRELSVKEARYRILNEQTNSIIFEYDIETGKVQCSPNGRMLDNYPACMQSFPDNIIAREDCCARDAKMLSKLFCEMKRGRVNGEMDLQLCTYNGSQCWFHLQLSDITDEVSLKPLRVVGKLTDIDAEK
ncbi:MAG: HAMP domain-containing protein, partial [Ruthenibacterium sp.]